MLSDYVRSPEERGRFAEAALPILRQVLEGVALRLLVVEDRLDDVRRQQRRLSSRVICLRVILSATDRS
jgi:hypothetical protein